MEVIMARNIQQTHDMAHNCAILNQKLAEDLKNPANCFEVGRHGDPKEGIVLRTDKGPDVLRPWEPYILIGTFRVHRDFWTDKERGPLGCLYHHDGDITFVRRAELHKLEKMPIYTLRRLDEEGPHPTMLLKVNLSLPSNGKLYSKGGHLLHVQVGVHGSAQTISSDNNEILICFNDGDEMNLLFPDGMVRSFKNSKSKLVENKLSPEEMATVRIEDAFKRLHRARINGDEKKVLRVIHSMADLITLTRFIKDGQDVRRRILSDFFLELPNEELSKVHRKVTAILHQTDSALVPMLQMKNGGDLSDLKQKLDQNPFFRVIVGGKSNGKGSEAKAKAKAKKVARAEADNELRSKMKGPSTGKPVLQSKKGKKQKRK